MPNPELVDNTDITIYKLCTYGYISHYHHFDKFEIPVSRGVIALRTLKMLQESCGTDITKLFDYVCGTSQGAILACLLFLLKVPLDDAEERYLEFSQMFNRNVIVGSSKLVWDHAYYDTDLWEKILK